MSEDSDESGGYSEAIGTRLTPQTNRQFQACKKENELGDAEALRRIVRRGLKGREEGQENRLVESTVFAAAISAFFLIVFEVIRWKVEREQDDRRRQRPTRMRGGGSP